MPAFALTAAEIAAAEAAAVAAAEAAAIQAAQVAAAEAAAAAAAEAAAAQAATQAGTQAAAQAGTQAATQASTSGIQTLAQEVGASVQPTGIETLTSQAELEQMRQAASGAQNLAQTPVQATTPMANPSMTQAQYDFLHNSVAGGGDQTIGSVISDYTYSPANTASVNPTLSQLPVTEVPLTTPVVNPSTASGFDTQAFEGLSQADITPTPSPVDTRLPTQVAQPGAPAQSAMNQVEKPLEWTPQTTAPNAGAATQPSGIEKLFDKGLAYAEKNPLMVGMGAMSLYNMLNQPKPYEKPKYKSTFNASAYRGYEPTPPTPYTPQYTQYAQGGLADLGGYSDYARGGRMLKGPGDGMSDDIPATIANKQPARLANEEFVVPADVVSHLGNGSSEAGAKALYKMMDRVRQARTGTKKQGKQINPEKYLA